ncbi:CsxC family protein [Clostridium puniceum]|nr:hypothetical protein [Clostridium puniceum]
MSDDKGNTNCSKSAEYSRESVERCAIVKSQVESLTEQVAVNPTVIEPGPVFVKIPVVLAETNITIPVEATIKLDQAAIEIKRIKKNVFLTQSRIIPFSQDGRFGTGILFIEGFIRKNIEFATQTCTTARTPNICGDIRHCTVEVPFNFTTRITFLRPPIFIENTTPSELEFFTDELQGCDVCSDPVIGRNPCDRSSFVTEFFNEKPFTELVRADITEIDINTNTTSSCKTPTEQKFTKLTEKVVVNLTLKVLQKQQVRVTAIC